MKKEEKISIGEAVEPEVGRLAKDVDRIGELQKENNRIVTYVILILVVMVATMIVGVTGIAIDAWRTKTSSTEDLRDKVLEQNFKIDTMTSGLQKAGFLK